MKICGIIAEYNPFHNGHLYQVNKAKEITNADAIVVVMSGNFVQRGEPACIDKWNRASMAIKNGVDAVFELPFYYSNSSAEEFAIGATTLLENLGVDFLCFGSENGNIFELEKIAKILNNPDDEFLGTFRNELKSGNNYSQSILKALGDELVDIKSNDMLGISYIRSILKYGYRIKPLAIKRIESEYNDESINHEKISSATAIRNLLNKRSVNYDILNKYVPRSTHEFMFNYPKFIDLNDFKDYINMLISREYRDNLLGIRGVNEGIEKRLYQNISNIDTVHKMIKNASTRRYTKARLSRLVVDIMLGVKALDKSVAMNQLDYARILAFNKETEVLRELKSRSDLFFISNLARDLKKYKKENYLLELDLKSTRIYSFVNYAHSLNRDYTSPPCMI